MHVIIQAHTIVSEICFIHSSCSAFLYEGHLLIYIQTFDFLGLKGTTSQSTFWQKCFCFLCFSSKFAWLSALVSVRYLFICIFLILSHFFCYKIYHQNNYLSEKLRLVLLQDFSMWYQTLTSKLLEFALTASKSIY